MGGRATQLDAALRGPLHHFVDDHTLIDFYPRLMNGKWTTIFGVFGNAEFEMALAGYLLVLAALLLAVAADGSRPTTTSALKRDGDDGARWADAAAAVGVLAPIPLTVVALVAAAGANVFAVSTCSTR